MGYWEAMKIVCKRKMSPGFVTHCLSPPVIPPVDGQETNISVRVPEGPRHRSRPIGSTQVEVIEDETQEPLRDSDLAEALKVCEDMGFYSDSDNWDQKRDDGSTFRDQQERRRKQLQQLERKNQQCLRSLKVSTQILA